MNRKIFLSLVASMVVVGTQANAFGFGSMSGTNTTTSNGTTGSMSGTSNGTGGSVQYGFSQDGGYICINGFSWMGSAGFQMSANNSEGMSFGSASGCGEDDFDFYYKTFGGFIEESSEYNSPNMKPGKDDVTQDGFWWREGEFSSPVYYGDPENDGKRYADDPNGAWPAWTWGHPEKAPFVSEGGEGDDIGGSNGIGLGGFGMGDGNKLKAGDTDTFYPLEFMEVNNYKNSFVGSHSSDVSWNVVIYDKDHNEVFKKNYTTTMYYWETFNFQSSKYGIVCPRSSVDAGEIVNDLAYDTAVHNDITHYWPIFGLDVDFKGDGKTDTLMCADAVKIKDDNVTDTFTVSKKMMGMAIPGSEKKYELSFDGPYIYDATKDGCPEVNEQGLPDTAEKWPAECFTKVDTLWTDEESKTRAFMRMSVTEVKDDKCDISMPEMPCSVNIPMEEKVKSTINNMMQKAGTTLEQAQQAVEDAQDCIIPGLKG